MTRTLQQDVAAAAGIKTIPTILDVVCRVTGMRFAAVARVTEHRWIACSVLDNLAFGLETGGELPIESTICNEVRKRGEAVIIDHVDDNPVYCNHRIPAQYGFQSYVSVPIRLADGSFFGTLCAIDPAPRVLDNPETRKMFEMFAEILGFHLTTVDRLKSTEATLSDERETAALREQFIAVLGHDMRSPLGAINTAAQVLLRMPLDDKAHHVAKMIRRSVTRMSELIEDVMDFARGRLGGGITVETAPSDLEPVLRQVIAEQIANAPGREIEAAIDLSATVDCDPKRIAQVASNLLANALVHGSPDEPIRLTASIRGPDFELAVANRGVPIPKETLEEIFLPYSRGNDRRTQNGLGLGLYICRAVAESHRGTIRVTSSPEETRFIFTIPRERSDS